jgi:hypothetical protein
MGEQLAFVPYQTQGESACVQSPRHILQGQVQWLADVFGQEPRGLLNAVAAQSLREWAERASEEDMSTYLQHARPFETGQLPTPEQVLAPPQPERQLGSVALDSAAA